MVMSRKKKQNAQIKMDDIFTMSFSSSIVMSQNKMATLVQGLCTGNHWESRIVVYYDNIYKIEKELR